MDHRTPGSVSQNIKPIFSRRFTSADQTITAAALLTIAHGLGVIPLMVRVKIRCTTAELGYSIGDELLVGFGPEDSTGYGIAVVADATNIRIRFSSTAGALAVINFSSGATASAITTTSWVLVAMALA